MGELSVHMLGSLPIWVSKDKINKYLLEGFKGQCQDIEGFLTAQRLSPGSNVKLYSSLRALS